MTPAPENPNYNYTSVQIGIKLYAANEAASLWKATYDRYEKFGVRGNADNQTLLDAIERTSLTAAVVHARCLLDLHSHFYSLTFLTQLAREERRRTDDELRVISRKLKKLRPLWDKIDAYRCGYEAHSAKDVCLVNLDDYRHEARKVIIPFVDGCIEAAHLLGVRFENEMPVSRRDILAAEYAAVVQARK